MITIIQEHLPQLLTGLLNTVFSSLIALIGSLILGTIFALFEISPNRLLRFIGKAYVEVFRNIPLLVIVLIFYIVIPMYIIKINGFMAGSIGLTIYTSAFIAEVIKAGILSIGKGQMEAARSNGMSYLQSMWYVVLPQAFKVVIPPLGNQFINLVKNSSILAFVAGADLMYQANSIASTTFQTNQTYLIVGLLYLILTMPLSYYMRHLEKKITN